MSSFVRSHSGAVSLSVLLHAVVMIALLSGLNFSRTRPVSVPQPTAIEAVMLDQGLVAAEMERRAEEIRAADRAVELEQQRVFEEQQQREREEAERVAREARQAEQAAEAERIVVQERDRQAQLELEAQRAEAERVAAERAEAAERERLAEQQRQREEAERIAREAEEARLAEERERARRAEEERQQREAAARQAREAEEARQRAEMERELQAALAAEEEVRQARNSGEFDRYLRQIQSRIEQAWIPPASALKGLECVVNVTQIPSGDVVGVTIGACTGDAAVRNSIEQAVLRASPLPTPSIPALFDRNLQVTFRPQF